MTPNSVRPRSQRAILPIAGLSPRGVYPGVALMFSLLLASACATIPATCQIEKEAEIPIEVVGRVLTVEVSINDRPAVVQIDTGANGVVTVTKAAAERLGLSEMAGARHDSMTVGGPVELALIAPTPISLGGLSTPVRVGAVVDGWAPKAHVTPLDGILGAGLLAYFDVDLDVPARRMTLYSTRDCSGAFIPWTEPYVGVPAQRVHAEMLAVPVELDGKRFDAVIDTGAMKTGVAESAVERRGLGAAPRSDEPTATYSGFGGTAVTAHSHLFRSVKIGDSVFTDIKLPILRTAEPGDDMLLGLDFVRRQRVWLAYGSSQVFLARPKGRADAVRGTQ
jgi:predicted aspartyl protease